MQLGMIRRAIEAGACVVGIGVLEYITQNTSAELWLEQLVPHPLVPVVPIVLGGIALTVRVYRAENAPLSEPAISLPEPAPDSAAVLATEPGPAPAPAAPAVTPPAVLTATGAAGAGPELPQLRDPDAVDAVARSRAVPVPEPTQPPTSFIPLPR